MNIPCDGVVMSIYEVDGIRVGGGPFESHINCRFAFGRRFSIYQTNDISINIYMYKNPNMHTF